LKSIHKCSYCGSAVTDSNSLKAEHDKIIKFGKLLDRSWICDDCLFRKQGIKSESLSYHEEEEKQKHDSLGITTPTDISLNTPPADKT
jgi:C4-type Zn-finger protein